MLPVIYYRESIMDPDEVEAIVDSKFSKTDLLSMLHANEVVIPRYSTLPFAKELYAEFDWIDCFPINSLKQHQFMADLFQWAEVLGDLTPRTYTEHDMRSLPEGAYVVKGETNSKKAYWNTHMFAPTKKDVPRIFSNLVDDCLIGNQKIAIREYVPLRTYMEGINGMPVTNEHRFFFLDDHKVASGFYWQNYVDDLPEGTVIEDPPEAFISNVASLLKEHTNFFCFDVGQKENGDWIVIEVNDATMSGLSCIDPKEFYANLYNATTKFLQKL